MISRTEARVLWFCATVALFYLLFPVVVVMTVSFSSSKFLDFPPPGYSLQWYRALLDEGWLSSYWITFQVGTLTALFSTLVGVPAAFALARYDFPFRRSFEALLLAAIIVPPIIKAISLYLFFAPIGLANTVLGLVLGHTVTGVPYVVINLLATLKGYDRDLERAAQAHGATPLQAIRTVTLPVLAPSVLVGAVFAFLQSAQELLVALFLLGTVEKPLAVRMWEGVRISLSPTIAAASGTLVVLALAALAVVALALRSRRRAPA
ncbi:ABC transporter permease [Aquibium sp. A9E412]|uniref:ABC transporter permease n=1 Tax=Aquibium sp. A9E412 TaxID=2976767 RepID=UPI0025B11AD6|nr:ABC transporter permease [Aquibium sp. A9E412]MDN2566948.1 ABC transporter permease [Aquibium sp. A9E412]